MFLFKLQLTFFTASVFLLICSYTDQSLVIGRTDPIVVTWGDDITLPCHLEPAVDAVAMTVEWSRWDLNPRYVHVRHEGEELVSDQHPSYKGRTSVSIDKLKLGDVSLNLSRVKLSDNGTYRCFVPETKRESRVELLVGAGSSPHVSLAAADRVTGAVVLLCESDGWFPEPQMLWLDAEGSLISAEATQSLRGPDGAYRVSSRVTVEKRRSTNFTCRVQQLRINQTREKTIHVPDEFFSSCSSRCSYGSWVGLGLFMVAAVVCGFTVMKLKHRSAKTGPGDGPGEDRVGLTRVESTEEETKQCINQMDKLEKELKEKQEKELKEKQEKELKELLEKLEKQLEKQLEDTMRELEELEIKLKKKSIVQLKNPSKEQLKKQLKEQLEKQLEENKVLIKNLLEKISVNEK